MQDNLEQKYNEVLASLGLSQEKIDYIRQHRSDKSISKLYNGGVTAYIVLMIVFMIGYVFLSRAIFFDYLMKQRTGGVDYIFYDSLWMIHIFPMMFIAILLPAWLLYKLMAYFPRQSELLAIKGFDDIAYRSINEHDVMGIWKSSRYFTRKIIDEKFLQMPIDEGLRYLNWKTGRWIGKCIIIMLIIAAPFIILDASNYKLATKEGVLERPYASFHTLNKTWDDVTKVETGCFYFTGKNRKLALKYVVQFDDGSEIDLFEAKANGNKVAQITAVNTALRELGKPFSIKNFTHGIHSGKPYVNDECFGKLQEEYPSEYSEIIKLLRIEKYASKPIM